VTARFTAVEISRSDYAAWNDAVRESPGGSVYCTPDYLDALCNVTGGQFRLLAVCDDTRIHGGIALYIRGTGKNQYVTGRYLLYYNGPFLRQLQNANSAAQESHSRRVMECLEAALRDSEYARIQIKARPSVCDYRVFLAQGWRARPFYSYEVDLSDIDRCFSRMHRNIRRQIRQAEKSGVTVQRSQDIDAFYDLHTKTSERKQFPTYLSRDGMSEYFRILNAAGLIRLYLGSQRDSVAGTGLLVLLGRHAVTHSVCAASIESKESHGINAFLRWHVFQELSDEGYLANDLTDAHEPDVARFKSQLGGELVMSIELRRPASVRDHLQEARQLINQQSKHHIKRLIGWHDKP